MSWVSTTLSEVSVDGRGSYGIAASAVPKSELLFTYLRITDIRDDGSLNKTGLQSVDAEGAAAYLLCPNDIVFARTGASTGRSYFYDGSDGELVYAGFLIKFSLDPDKVFPRYIKYYCLSARYRAWVAGHSVGSTRGNCNASDFAAMPLFLPPLPVQRKIADVLGAYDELIENNRKRIALLEKMARELYRERFVRRSRKGYPKALANFCTVQYGYAFNSKEFNAGGQGLPIVRIRNIPQGASTDYTTEKAPEEYIVHDGELLVGMDGEFHINLWSGGDAYLVQRSCCFRPYDESVKGFLMEAIRAPIKYFESSAMGATVGHLGKKDIDTISLYEPTDEENALFNEMYKERLSLSLQSRILAKQRDRLLPRLMSGKIDVEKLVKEGK